jgi:hypothetical protein
MVADAKKILENWRRRKPREYQRGVRKEKLHLKAEPLSGPFSTALLCSNSPPNSSRNHQILSIPNPSWSHWNCSTDLGDLTVCKREDAVDSSLRDITDPNPYLSEATRRRSAWAASEALLAHGDWGSRGRRLGLGKGRSGTIRRGRTDVGFWHAWLIVRLSNERWLVGRAQKVFSADCNMFSIQRI